MSRSCAHTHSVRPPYEHAAWARQVAAINNRGVCGSAAGAAASALPSGLCCAAALLLTSCRRPASGGDVTLLYHTLPDVQVEQGVGSIVPLAWFCSQIRPSSGSVLGVVLCTGAV